MLSRMFLSLMLALPALTTLSRAIMCPASADTGEQASGAMCAPAPDACCCGPADPAGDSCGCVMDSAPAEPTNAPTPAPRPTNSTDQVIAAMTRTASVVAILAESDAKARRSATSRFTPSASHHARLATLGVWRT